jgi:hypothetical protein
MDTLCLPLKKHHAALWEQSLNSMASIYAGAETTIVFDAELTATNVDSYEFLGRLICSVWMRRSWTLQEGLLSPTCTMRFGKDLFVVFYLTKQSFIHIYRCGQRPERVAHLSQPDAMSDAVRRRLQKYLEHHFVRTRQVIRFKEKQLAIDLHAMKTRCSPLEERRMLEDAVDPHGLRVPFSDGLIDLALSNAFVLVWNALSGRSTTKSDDLPLIMANILDFNCSQLLSLSLEDRWQAITFSLPRLPLSLLFISAERFESEERPFNRWVPLKPCTEPLSGESTLRVIPWNDEFSGSFLEIQKGVDIRCVIINDASLLRCHEFIVSISDSRRSTRLSLVCKGSDDRLPMILSRESEEAVIIFEDGYYLGTQTRGAVFQVLRHQGNTIQLVYRCAILITRSFSMNLSDSWRNPHKNPQTYQGAFLDPFTSIFLAYGKSSP